MSWSASRWSTTPSTVTALVSLRTVLLFGSAYAGGLVMAPIRAAVAAADTARWNRLDMGISYVRGDRIFGP